jgi:hypothetical protein
MYIYKIREINRVKKACNFIFEVCDMLTADVNTHISYYLTGSADFLIWIPCNAYMV